MAGTTYAAFGINLVVAVIALVLAGDVAYRAPARPAPGAPALKQPGSRFVYVAVALSGMAALGAEVVVRCHRVALGQPDLGRQPRERVLESRPHLRKR